MNKKSSKKDGSGKNTTQVKTKGKAVPLDAYIGKNLRKFRELAGLTQEKLADEVNISYQQLQKNECGGNRIAASRLYEFARILGRNVDDFYDGYNGIYKTESVDALHSVSPEMKLLIKNISNIQDEEIRKNVIKGFSKFSIAFNDKG